MIEIERNQLLQNIDRAIDNGINFLQEHQLHNGEFMTYISPDEKMMEWAAPESTTYVTAIIGLSLMQLQHRPDVDRMLSKSTGFLQYQAMRNGVWNHFTRLHWMFSLTPPDTDDTAIISLFLRARNETYVDNRTFLLQNRSPNGLFYTWFTLHPTFYKFSKSFWRLIARELKQPIKNLLFWRRKDVNRGDIDPIVNANIIAYLGHSTHTDSAIAYVAGTLKSNENRDSDHWYKNHLVFYYFLARLVPLNILPIISLKTILEERILEETEKNKNFYECDLEMAIAASSLLMLNSTHSIIYRIVQQLLSQQAKNGRWRRFGFFTTPTREIYWGSEELTTALAIEALHLYKARAKKDLQ